MTFLNPGEKPEEVEFITTKDVIAEIKDQATREFVDRVRGGVPYKLHIREATQEALDFVVDFSKKTGDF